MNKPMFYFTGIYETPAQAESDYDGSDFQEAEREAMGALKQQERVAASV